ncbi:MAG: hypothetical protein DWQ19_11580 [Crenarchaeota archaeon]|nr:MAG: hypothetical protein DWQ19_11580 [Thermoproteota archaeon]
MLSFYEFIEKKKNQEQMSETQLGFGKFSDRDVQDIPKPYLQWVLKNVEWLRPELRAEIEAKLGSVSQTQSGPPQRQQPAATQTWVLSKVIADNQFGLSPGTKVALSKTNQGNWNFVTLDVAKKRGILPGNMVAQIVQSERDAQGRPITSQNLADLFPTKQKDKKQSPLIPDDLMSEEQDKIDKRFEQLINNPDQSHIMISALAGSGKTTMLKHLAWKYGSPQQKWLYLVFNTKNKVEATQKFPSFVDVKTTNGFLGEVLRDKKNINKIPQTERMVNLSKYKGKRGDDSNTAGLEKARIIVDGPEFNSLMKQFHIPEKVDAYEYGSISKTVNSLLRGIRYTFKEQVLTLAGLAKSFALDPRKSLDEGIQKILDNYDFDTELSDIKERIAKYSGSFRSEATDALNDAMGIDFMQKDYKDEIVEAAKWLMNSTMPGGTSQKYKKGSTEHDLGQFRDFNDDLWFAAIHGDEIVWPKYDIVLADEVQDFNEAQKIMLKKLHDAGAKIVAVGDSNQSIYRFRGADSEAFDNISNQLTDLSKDKNVVHRLTTNFRSRKAILDFANDETHVKDLKGRKFNDDYEGAVTKFEKQYDDAFEELKAEQAQGERKPTAFISRTNEPLVHAALKLLGAGIPFMIVGKDIAKDLSKHIRKIIARFRINDQDDADYLSERMKEFHQEEQQAHEGKSTKKAYLHGLGEVTDAITSAINQFSQDNEGGTVKEFLRWLSERLGGLDVQENEKELKEYQRKLAEENPVVLTTAHRSKGLEFPRVFILRYDLFPHKKAKRPADLQQEENSKYVAITRAEDELHIIDPESEPGSKKGKE